VHLWFERKIPESADADIDQTERWMIERDVAAAFRAITTIADVAALEFSEELRAFHRSDSNRSSGDRRTRHRRRRAECCGSDAMNQESGKTGKRRWDFRADDRSRNHEHRETKKLPAFLLS
jgi:hypothetical protein